ncbi:MAG TPA: sigma-70 family RNA polymerase sigma factor [Candidatus Limnocylindrales bacterium]|nr:sigma-70 family RNA polymerase sigma factor [Candidatus Limnocylindrales bacterium]
MRATVDPAPASDLVRRASRGDVAAFDALVSTRLSASLRLARAIVDSPVDAEDVVQEAFVNAWRNLRRLREPDRFDAWFGRILVNTARTHVRRRGAVRPISIDRRVDDGREDDTPSHHDPGLESVVHGDALGRAIDRLTVDQRTILALHHLEERPVAQIAAVLKIPVGTAKWRLHAARQALERALEAER